VASWIYLSNDLITLVYWKQAGTNTEFWAKTCAVNVASLINCSTFSLFTKPNHSACGGTGVCAAAAVASDVPANPSSGSKIYAAIRYLSPGNCGAYCYRIMYSTNGGTSWTTSLAEQPVTTATRIPVVLTELSSGEMLFAYASYQDAELKYRTGTGTSWSGESSTSGMGMGTSTVKHISADSDVEQQAYVTGLSSGISGNLKVTTWTNTGSFGGVTTASSSPSHSLPAMTITPEGMMRIYTISGGKIYETKKVYTAGSWNPSVQVFPTGLNTANQLTAAITSSAALWTENTSTPYKIYFDKDPLDPGTGPAFQEDWEFHPGQGYLGTRAWIKILNPSITNCANLNPNCLYESVIAAYDGGSPTSDRGAVGSGWFKWKNAAGSGEVWLAFLYANFDKKYVSYKKTQQWTSFGVERNFVVNYQFEDSDGDDFWQRSVCTADPCSNGIVLQQDTVKFDDFDSSAQTRISAWTTHNTVQLGAGTTPAQFRDWKMFNYFHDPPIRWEPINGFGPYCTVDPVYYVHSHPTNLYHMGPPVVTGEIDNTGNCIGAPIPDIFQ
jgi:hypothetical protein